MKANFALILDQDGIVLLNRAKVTWRVVGQAHPASERLVEEMAYLRRTAMELSGGRFSTKLVIPNSQILYTALQIDPARDDRKNAIREALEGLTPYAVDELTFDWTDQDDGSVTVAAVADITLSEAEAFADEHRFNPLSFVAIPEALDFPKEPFFGATAKSRDLLNPGGVVEQDIEPIDIVAVLADLDKATAAATASDSMVATGADAPVPLVARAQEDEVPVPETEQAETPELEPVEEAAVEDDVVEAVAGADAEERAVQDAEPGTNEDVSEELAPAPSEESVTADEDQAEPLVLKAQDVTEDEPAIEAVPAEDEPEASASADAVLDAGGDEVADDEAIDDGDADADEPEISFVTSRMKQADEPVTPELSGIAARFSPRAEPVVLSTPVNEPENIEEPGPDPEEATSEAPEIVPVPPASEPAQVTTVAEKMAALKSGAPRASDAVPILPAPPKQVSPSAGAAGRFGLLLVLGLLAALGLASATAYVMLGDPDNPLDGAGLAESVPQSFPSPSAAVEPSPGAEDVLPGTDERPVGTDAVAGEQIVAFDPLADTDVNPDTRALYGIDAPEITLSGIRQLAPVSPVVPSSERIDDLYTPSLDRVVVSHDAVAIAPLGLSQLDPSIGLQLPPPEFGRNFAFGDDGLVVPTPEGTLSPEGILIFSGVPAIRALPRPFVDVVIAPDGLTDERRAELAAILPTPRPGTIAEDTERAQLSGLSRDELSGIRPLPRPAALEALAIALASQPAPEAGEPTERAVTASRLPVARPSGLAEAARTAAVAAVRPPPPPQGASVTQAATIENGLRLNQVNLIGVYGSSSSRRALVRLTGGRFVMVTVGERLNGGVVQAISSDSLIYRKGGRNITLEVPNG